MITRVETEIGGRVIAMEIGKMAKQANGSVVVTSGDNKVLVTVVAEKESKNLGFLPLTIEYQERMYAAGRIPGSYFRREIGRIHPVGRTGRCSGSSRQAHRVASWRSQSARPVTVRSHERTVSTGTPRSAAMLPAPAPP